MRSPIVAAAIVLLATGGEASPMFTGLGFLPGVPGGTFKRSVAIDVSADGSVAVGVATSATGYDAAVRWENGGPPTRVGDLGLAGQVASYAYGVSADGNTIVGEIGVNQNPSPAFRWTPAAGPQSIGVPPGGVFARAWATSADGSVVVGYGNASGPECDSQLGTCWSSFRWENGTMERA